MKKAIVSILMIAGIAATADAKMRAKAKKPAGHIPYAQNQNIDHSKDVAFSAQWAHQAQSPTPNADFRAGSEVTTVSPVLGKTIYYGYPLSNFTLYGYVPAAMSAPYNGQDAPSYDGPAKNKYRNMRASNESEPLPANDGGNNK